MASITVYLEDEIARHVEESAKREQKSVSEWIGDRIRTDAERASVSAEREAQAALHGYPAGWQALFGSLADDDSFNAPERLSTRPVEDLSSH